MPRLDTLKSPPYKTRPLWLAGALLLAFPATGFEGEGGARLPDGAQKVAERRYRARQDYEDTLKHYKSVYPPSTYLRKAIVNQPGIKAVHIENPSRKGFEGLNIYQANDEVRIYIVPGEMKPKKEEEKKKSKNRSP